MLWLEIHWRACVALTWYCIALYDKKVSSSSLSGTTAATAVGLRQRLFLMVPAIATTTTTAIILQLLLLPL